MEIPTCHCYKINISVNGPNDAAICASFRKEGEWTITRQHLMHPKEARQLEKSLSNPTYEETSPFALQSGEMVKSLSDGRSTSNLSNDCGRSKRLPRETIGKTSVS